MLKIKNGRLDQYDTGPFEQQQFGTAGVEGVNNPFKGCPSETPHSRTSICPSATPLLTIFGCIEVVLTR